MDHGLPTFFINLDGEIIAWMNLARKVYLIFEVVIDDWPRRCWWVLSILELSQFWKPYNQEPNHAQSGLLWLGEVQREQLLAQDWFPEWGRELERRIQFGSWDWKRDEVESVKLKLTGYYDSVTWGGLWVVMLMDHQQADQVTTTTSLCRIMNVMLRAWLQPVSLD